jgi:hypothetical protein
MRLANYTPPYESPLEDIFAWDVHKFLGNFVSLAKQEEAQTPFGLFKIDFVAKTRAGRRIGFECDGKDYHKDKQRDQLRDAVILNAGHVDLIYRFRGQDLFYHSTECLYFLTFWEPDLFGVTGTYQLSLLASDGAKRMALDAKQWCGSRAQAGSQDPPEGSEPLPGAAPVAGSWLWTGLELDLHYGDGCSRHRRHLVIQRHTREAVCTKEFEQLVAEAQSRRVRTLDGLLKLRAARGR